MAQPVSETLSESQSAILTASFWLAYLLEGLAVADFTIDTERLGADAKYRCEIGDALVDSLGRDAFADYRATPCRDDFVAYARPLANSWRPTSDCIRWPRRRPPMPSTRWATPADGCSMRFCEQQLRSRAE